MLMSLEKVREILSSIKVPLEHRLFYPRVHLLISKSFKKEYSDKEGAVQALAEEFNEISFHLDKTAVQESCSFRNNERSRYLAKHLISQDGKLNRKRLEETFAFLKRHLYSLGPGRYHDSCRQEHILKVLKLLLKDKEYERLLQRVSRPFNKGAEKIIRETLGVPREERLTDAHARQAVLAAWMAYLRQNVGSCFATAPAIIIQGEQDERFLRDLAEMLSTERIKRTFGGVEYSVPMSGSWGVGDLKKPFVLNSETPIGKSYGFILAFEAAGLLSKNLPNKRKIVEAQSYIFSAFYLQGQRGGSLVVTPEQVIQRVLLKHNKLTEKDLEELGGETSGRAFLGWMGKVSKGGRGGSYKRFYEQFELAKVAFKNLTDNALLKSWEFTIASFAETKAIFSRWNLYSSLGLAPEDKDGIGSCLFEQLKEKLEKANTLVHEMNEKYESYFQQVKYIEAKMSRAASDDELRYLKVEYQTLVSEMNFYLEGRERAHFFAHRWANLFNFLIEQYDSKFKEYFQEVYDADMHDVTSDPYDDSPAGFRLVYKHGRASTSAWTQIRGHEKFIDCLAEFFSITEREITALPEMKGIEQDFGEIVTRVVSHVRTRAFLESSLFRMAAAHGGHMVKNPLENLDKIDKKPWVYTSGGTMNHLVSCYYCREDLPATDSRWVESEEELLAFFLDVMKGMPDKTAEKFLANPEKSMLVHSPTHAFVLKPGRSPFKEGWLNKDYTYTWIRDAIVIPRQHFIKSIDLSPLMMEELAEELSRRLSEPYRHRFKQVFNRFSGVKGVEDFRRDLLEAMHFERGLHIGDKFVFEEWELDSFFYEMLPMRLGHEIKPAIQEIFSLLSGLEEEVKEKALEIFEELSDGLNRYKVFSAKGLQDLVKTIVMLASNAPLIAVDLGADICRIAQELGLAMPSPVIFADTNWTKDFFAFVVNPGNLSLELWRVDCIGREGAPMYRWKRWLDGSRKSPEWGIYIRPHEYGGV